MSNKPTSELFVIPSTNEILECGWCVSNSSHSFHVRVMKGRKLYTEYQKKLHTFVFLFPESMSMCFDQNFTCRLHGYWSITYTHVRSKWINKCRLFRSDIIMQFTYVNLVHRYIKNWFITERLPIHLADVKNTTFSLKLLSTCLKPEN